MPTWPGTQIKTISFPSLDKFIYNCRIWPKIGWSNFELNIAVKDDKESDSIKNDCMRNTLFSFFFLALRSFWWGHMWCVSLEWRTDWIDCELSLFTPCSRLRRRNVKKQKKTKKHHAASSVALHGLQDHCGQRIEYRTRNSEAGCAIPSLALVRGIAVDNILQTFHQKIASNVVNFEVMVISCINS